MNAKERAKELVNKYYSDLKQDNTYYDLETAKSCALICVKEILNILFQHHEIDYWKEVKREIEKL